MPREAVERNVNTAALIEVARNVLPEIRELERRASEIGKPLAFGIPIAAKVENEAPHRIGGVEAITKNGLPRMVAVDGLVLAEGDEQIRKGFPWNITGADGRFERDE